MAQFLPSEAAQWITRSDIAHDLLHWKKSWENIELFAHFEKKMGKFWETYKIIPKLSHDFFQCTDHT